MNTFLQIDAEAEKQRIVSFLKKTFKAQGIEKAIIGLSGGIDSTVSFYLVKEVLSPENIIAAHLYYDSPVFPLFHDVLDEAHIPHEDRYELSIKQPVEAVANVANIAATEKVRLGNIAARIRMVVLFDLAKKYNALVCGTENKSENLLGYFTRFGDQASDIEPIEHLYKSQIYQLAKHLGIPQEIIKQNPTAGLWANQTDEGDFGFTYEEADQVLYLHVEKHVTPSELIKQGFKNTEKILQWKKKNEFKHQVPYVL